MHIRFGTVARLVSFLHSLSVADNGFRSLNPAAFF